MKRLMLLIFSVTLTAILTAGCGGSKVPTAQLLTKSMTLTVEGNWKEAGELAAKAAKQDPNSAEASVLLALSLENTSRIDDALDEINKAVELNPKLFIAQYTKGRLLFAKEKYESSIAPLKAALALKPESTDTVILLAQASSNINSNDAAGYYAMLAKNARYKTRPEPWNELGIFFLSKKDYQKAKAYFRQAEKLAPGNPICTLNLAIINDQYLNLPAESVSYYNKFMRLTESNPGYDSVRQDVSERLKKLSVR